MTIQGKSKLMLLDTGGAITELTSRAVDELGLSRRRGDFQIYGVSGNYTDKFTEASFVLGHLSAPKEILVIAPEGETFGNSEQVAGLLASDILKNFDVSVDFGANKFSLLSPDHCAGKVVYWKASAVAVVPMLVLASAHIVVPVKLDGQPITAILDTGAPYSTLKLPAAESEFGLKPGSDDTPRLGSLQGLPSAITYSHQFKSLEFEGIGVNNLTVEIIPDRIGDIISNATTAPTGTRIPDRKLGEAKPVMLIGMDVLRHLHLYIAYKEEKLYITPAGEPDARNGAAGN